jgi:hypothetical protein
MWHIQGRVFRETNKSDQHVPQPFSINMVQLNFSVVRVFVTVSDHTIRKARYQRKRSLHQNNLKYTADVQVRMVQRVWTLKGFRMMEFFRTSVKLEDAKSERLAVIRKMY